jgi:hypothetical protein
MAGIKVTEHPNIRTDNPLTYRNFENLAIKVVETASDEYRRAYRRQDEGRMEEIQKFFHSRRGNLFCFGNAEYVFNRLQSDLKKGTKKTGRSRSITKM